MPYEGTTFFLAGAAGDGAANQSVQPSDPGATSNATTTASVGTSGAGDYPMKSNVGSNAKSAFTTNAFDDGWNMKVSNTDATANLPATRRVLAGTWTMTGGVGIPSGTGFPLGGSITVKVNVYGRTSAGVMRFLGTLTGTGSPVALSTQTWTSSGSMPEVVLAVGETLHFEIWYTVPNATLTNYVLSLVYGTGFTLTLPGAGLRYLYSRAISAATATAVAFATKKINLGAKVATATALAFLRNFVIYKVFTATATAIATVTRKTLLGTKVAGSTAVAIVTKKTLLHALAANATAVAFLRNFVIFKRVVATSTPVAFVGKLLNKYALATSTAVAIRRPFVILKAPVTATSTGVGWMWIQISQAILNRMTGGSTVEKSPAIIIVDEDVAMNLGGPIYTRI